jgi:hypothetical protein
VGGPALRLVVALDRHAHGARDVARHRVGGVAHPLAAHRRSGGAAQLRRPASAARRFIRHRPRCRAAVVALHCCDHERRDLRASALVAARVMAKTTPPRAATNRSRNESTTSYRVLPAIPDSTMAPQPTQQQHRTRAEGPPAGRAAGCGNHRHRPVARTLKPPKQHGRPVWRPTFVHPSSGTKERALDRGTASRRHVTLLRHRCRRLVRRRRGGLALNHRGASAATATRASDAGQVLSCRHLSQPDDASGRLTVLGDASSLH